jgi:hypothetical protein
MQLIEQGRSVEQIAAHMGLTVPRVERYIEEEIVARNLSHHRCDQIPAVLIRRLYQQRRDEDPTLSMAKVARAAKLDRSAVSAVLGSPTLPSDDDEFDRARQGQDNQALVSVDVAARIVRALGVAPHEIRGL